MIGVLKNRLPLLFPSAWSPKASIWERLGWSFLVCMLAAGYPLAMHRALHTKGGTDFPEFYDAGRHVLEHGEISPVGFLKYYWPSLDVAWAGLAWMPAPVAATVWYLVGCAVWFALLRTIDRDLLSDVRRPHRRHAVLATALLMLALVIDHLCLGAFHLLMVWLMVAGLTRVRRGCDLSGGALLGLAVWVKLLPLVGVGYLVLKRKWQAAVTAVVAAVLVDLALTLPVLGPAQTWREHVRWWENQAVGASQRILSDRGNIDEDRLTNQSIPIVLRRLFSTMGLYPDCPWKHVILADLDPEQLRLIYHAILGVLGVGVLSFCRRPGRSTSEPQWSAEIALVALSTLWFSPVAWGYHATAAAPALAVVLGREKHPRLRWGTAMLWLLALALMGSNSARAIGEMLWTTLLIGAFVVSTVPSRRRLAVATPGHFDSTTRDAATPTFAGKSHELLEPVAPVASLGETSTSLVA